MSPTILQNETAGGFSTFQVQDSVHPITAPSRHPRLPFPTAGRRHRAPTCPHPWSPQGKLHLYTFLRAVPGPLHTSLLTHLPFCMTQGIINLRTQSV